ncbi:MAG: YqaE/Pmp3 family membrane protein [Candidatus Kapabacteria bacterium]|nr:YqaE/Pmp3 family membrane protein [Candidatus Kapabacteria bacterium]
MSIFRVILCVVLPPLAVIDKGCGSIVIVSLLTLAGWVPGVIGALVIVNRSNY